MTWTYSGDPAASDRDQVRFWCGDTNTLNQQINDEEIAFLIANETSLEEAGAVACEQMIAALILVDKKVGDLEHKLSQRVEALEKRAKSLRKSKGRAGRTAFAGGISKSERDAQAADPDNVGPEHKRHQFQMTNDIGNVPGDIDDPALDC